MELHSGMCRDKLFEIVRTIDPSGAIVGRQAILKDLRQVIEQRPGLDGRKLGTAYHHGVRITRTRHSGYLEDHLVLAFALKVVNDSSGAVAACAFAGQGNVIDPGYFWIQGPVERPLGVQFGAAISEVVAQATEQLSRLDRSLNCGCLADGSDLPEP